VQKVFKHHRFVQLAEYDFLFRYARVVGKVFLLALAGEPLADFIVADIIKLKADGTEIYRPQQLIGQKFE